MGRLFWKILLLTLLAQVVATFGTITTFKLRERSLQSSRTELDISPPAAMKIDAAASTLQYGGPAAFRDFASNLRDPAQVIAVDDAGKDLLGRTVTPQVLEQARSLVGRFTLRRAVREVVTSDGKRYLVFVPSDHGFPNPSPASADATRPEVFDRDHDHDLQGGRGPHGRGYFPFFPLITGVLASLIFASILAWFLSKPIRRLRDAFAAAAEGDLTPKFGDVSARRLDEMATLGREFDAMTERLSVLMDGQRRLLHDVSHEMRSPLARMQAAIGLARQKPEQVLTTLDRIERESIRMDKLVDEILTLSRVQAGVTGSHDEDINIDALLAGIVDDAQIEATPKQCTVVIQHESGAWVRGREELLHRAIENIVRNAIKFTKHGTQVMVDAQTILQGKTLRLRICDQGTGVAANELTSIFLPFYRGLETEKDGHGLGLAIAQRVIIAHGGKISATNRSEGGLCVEVELPLIHVSP